MEWKDTSSYSKSDKERIPTSWCFYAGEIRISVHRHIYYDEDTWLLSCDPFFNKYELPHKDIEKAKRTALDLVATKLRIVNSILAEYIKEGMISREK